MEDFSNNSEQRKHNIERIEKIKGKGFDIFEIPSTEIPLEINSYLSLLKTDKSIDKRGGTFHKMYPNFSEQKYVEFLDKITDGKYSDIRNPNTSIGAWNERGFYTFGNAEPYLLTPISDKHGLWFSHGPSNWVAPDRTLIIFNTENPNFRRYLVYCFINNSFVSKDPNDELFNVVKIEQYGTDIEDFRENAKDAIFTRKEDIDSYEKLKKYLPNTLINKIDKRIEEMRVEEDGEIYYEVDNYPIDIEQELFDQYIYPLLLLQGLPIKPQRRISNDWVKYTMPENSKEKYFRYTHGFLLARTDPNADAFIREMEDLEEFNQMNPHPFLSKDLSLFDMATVVVEIPERKVYKYKIKNNDSL